MIVVVPERLTWVQYARAVQRAAGALAGLGVQRGDRGPAL
jgi:acyl-coenzyme A synthetase/AMP-(fatty) acid ligase